MGRIWPIYGPYMARIWAICDIWAIYGPYMAHIWAIRRGNKRDLYPRPVWCGRVGGCGGNTRDFGEHATKGGNKRDFGKHATKVGTLKEFRKKDENFAIFLRNRRWE